METYVERTAVDDARGRLHDLFEDADHYEALADKLLESGDEDGSNREYEILQKLFREINDLEDRLEDLDSDI